MSDETLRLLTRRGCHLCDLIRGPLRELTDEAGFRLLEFDIDDDADLRSMYDARVPVLLRGEAVVAEGRFDPALAVNSLARRPWR